MFRPSQVVIRRSAREEGHIRELALVAGCAILLFVFAILLLAAN
jgi:hypothetical protein